MILVNLMQTVLKRRAKARAARKLFRQRHPEKARAEVKAWVAANPERMRELKRNEYARNGAVARAYGKRYRKEKPEVARLALMRYRTRRKNTRGHATAEQIRARVAYFGGVCSYCGGPFEELDHTISLSRGGTNWPANIRPACTHCNRSKSSSSLLEFLAWRT